MKEKKFKVWDKTNKKMWTDIQLQYSDGKWSAMPYGKDANPIHDLILLEFTGKFDKNKKEIYEDDIIEFTYKIINSTTGTETIRKEIARVVWGSYMDGEYVSDIQCWMVKEDSLSELLTYYPSYGHQKVIDSKVIRNFNENGDLLK